MSIYGTSAVRARRTKSGIDELDCAIIEVFNLNHPMTVRGVLYRVLFNRNQQQEGDRVSRGPASAAHAASGWKGSPPLGYR